MDVRISGIGSRGSGFRGREISTAIDCGRLLPIAVAGVLGDFVLNVAGFSELFITAAVCAGLALFLAIPLRERKPELAEGQVLARIDHFALTSNNITYSVIGHMMGYWDFFPPADEGWGRVPAFGHADIVESRCDGIEVGARAYGYFPMASHLILEPGRINPHSFHDMAEP